MLVRVFCQDWVSGLIAVKPRTRRRYASIIRAHIVPELGRLELGALSRARLKQFMAKKSDLGLAPTTLSFLAKVLRLILDAAIEDGYLSVNHMRAIIKTTKLDRRARAFHMSRVKAFRLEELERLLSEAWKTERYYYPIATLAWTGIRLGEMIALEPSDFDPVNGLLHITKTAGDGETTGTTKNGKPRAVDIPTALLQDLQIWILEIRPWLLEKWELKKDPPRLFFTEAGGALNPRNFRRAFLDIVTRAGLPKHSPHDLRHTYASILLQRGESIQYVSHQLGHSSIGFTHAIYGRWLRPYSKEVIETLARNPTKKSAKILTFPTR